MLAAVRGRRPLPLGDEGRRRARRPARAPGRGGRARRRRGPHRCRVRRVASTRSPTATRPARGGSSAPGRSREWWAEQRERVLAGDLIEPVKVGYAESMKLSPRWAAEFRGFWDLPEDFAFEIDDADAAGRPDGAAGQGDARGVGGRVPRRLARSPRSSRRALAGKPLERETLAALLDEKLVAPRGEGHPVGLQGPRPLRQVARGPPGARRRGTTRSCCRWARR